jgi:hypothetical protein
MNAYEIMLDIGGEAVTRTEWAYSAMDAAQIAIMNAAAAEMGVSRKIRFMHIGPPMAEIVRAQEELAKAVVAATDAATTVPRSGT